MSEFVAKTVIDAPADDVFTFVTDLTRMPEYLPMLKQSTPEGDGHVRLRGQIQGKDFDVVGWYQIHELNRTMLWGATSRDQYGGDLEVMDQGRSCFLTVSLSIEALPDMSPEDREKLKSSSDRITQGLEDALQEIRQICESSAVTADNRNKPYMF